MSQLETARTRDADQRPRRSPEGRSGGKDTGGAFELEARTNDDLIERYSAVRGTSAWLCEPLVVEDFVVQSMPDVSPTKWHLAHTSWFFETFLLKPHLPGYREFDPAFAFLFNSYYVTLGDRHCRQNRGQLSRPTVEEVYAYRAHVDDHMRQLLAAMTPASAINVRPLVEVGLHHEQQHQELMAMDLKHVFWVNPLRPAYRPRKTQTTVGMASIQQTAAGAKTNAAESTGANRHPRPAPAPVRWVRFDGGLVEVGHDSADGAFAFDNESPRHKVYLKPFALADRLVTNGEFKRFIAAGGYTRAELWLSAGAATAKEQGWEAPLYWIKQDGRWMHHTLAGLRPVEDDEPVCHVSFYEADAFARWLGARLPTEAEWETAAGGLRDDAITQGNFLEDAHFHPLPARVATRRPAVAPPLVTSFLPAETASASSSPNDASYSVSQHPLACQDDSQSVDSKPHLPPAPPPPQLRQMFGDVWEWTASAYLGYPGYQPPAGALGEYNGKFMSNQFVLRGGCCVTPRSHVRATYRNFFPPDARWQFAGLRLAKDLTTDAVNKSVKSDAKD